MWNLGTVKPGSTIEIPFDTFDGGTGAPITITDLALADIHIYKDGGMTQRASTSGFTLLDTDGIDLDTIIGIHGVSIDLSDNATANFYEAGSRYMVRIGPFTVDGQTMNFWAAMFRIGYEGAILDTTIATLSSQISFTLEDGSADDDAYNGCVAVVHDLASAVQVAIVYVSDYTGSTKTVTLAVDPAIFTMAAGDHISIMPRVDLGAIGGSVQSQADLKDFADAGYDPATNKVEGVKLVDTTTANTDMRGTDNAALASVLGALADAAAAGDPTASDTAVAYLKQLVNVLVGTTGVTTFPSEAPPANNVSLAEVIRAIYADVTGIGGITPAQAGDAMALTAAAVDSIWDEAAAGHVGAGTIGERVERLDLLASGGAGELTTGRATNLDNLDALITSRAAPGDAMALVSGALDSLALDSTAVDEIWDEVIPELAQAQPAATPTVRNAIMLIYMAFRNEDQSTSSEYQVKNDAGTVIAKSSLSDVGGTFTRAKLVSGP